MQGRSVRDGSVQGRSVRGGMCAGEECEGWYVCRGGV